MDIRSIRYFLAVAEDESFSRAAERLNVAQPAVSRQLQALEQDLGKALIERSSKGARLTPFGQVFYDRFKEVVVQFDTLIEEAKAYRPRKRQRLQIGLPPTSAERFGASLLALGQDHAPAYDLTFVEGLSRFLSDWLSDKTVDLIITSHRNEDPEISYTPLTLEPLALLVPVKHRLAQAEGLVPIAQLDREPLVLSTVFYRIFKAHAAQYGVTAHCALSVDSIAAARQILHETTRASLLPLAIAKREAFDPRFTLRELDHPPLRPLFLGMRRGETRPELLNIARALVLSCQEGAERA